MLFFSEVLFHRLKKTNTNWNQMKWKTERKNIINLRSTISLIYLIYMIILNWLRFLMEHRRIYLTFPAHIHMQCTQLVLYTTYLSTEYVVWLGKIKRKKEAFDFVHFLSLTNIILKHTRIVYIAVVFGCRERTEDVALRSRRKPTITYKEWNTKEKKCRWVHWPRR